MGAATCWGESAVSATDIELRRPKSRSHSHSQLMVSLKRASEPCMRGSTSCVRAQHARSQCLQSTHSARVGPPVSCTQSRAPSTPSPNVRARAFFSPTVSRAAFQFSRCGFRPKISIQTQSLCSRFSLSYFPHNMGAAPCFRTGNGERAACLFTAPFPRRSDGVVIMRRGAMSWASLSLAHSPRGQLTASILLAFCHRGIAQQPRVRR